MAPGLSLMSLQWGQHLRGSLLPKQVQHRPRSPTAFSSHAARLGSFSQYPPRTSTATVSGSAPSSTFAAAADLPFLLLLASGGGGSDG